MRQITEMVDNNFVFIVGRHYDKYGNLENWWSNKSSLEFKKKSQCMIDQYSKLTFKGNHVSIIIGKFDIFPLMCAADKVWINELTLIHKNIRSVRNSHAHELTLILKIIGQCDFKHILTSLIITTTPVLKISTYIITSITARPVRLSVILAIMSVSTFKTAVILYIVKLVLITWTILPLISPIIGQCDVKHIMTLPIKTVTSVLKVLTYIITHCHSLPHRTH